MTEITYDEARASEVRVVIVEFSDAEYRCGPKATVNSMRNGVQCR